MIVNQAALRSRAMPTLPAYLDFDLAIDQDGAGGYVARVLSSPAGTGRASFAPPAQATAWTFRPTERTREIRVVNQPETVMDAPTFGTALCLALINGDVRDLYIATRQQARSEQKGLRLKLRVEPNELLSVPWELLYDPGQGEFLCLLPFTQVLRFTEVAQPIQPMAVPLPLRILGMTASPRGLPELKVAEEQARLTQVLAPLQTRGLVELDWVPGQTWRELQAAMQRGPWHIFHYIGHADFVPSLGEGALALADEEGELRLLHASQLARLLASQTGLRLAVLNACKGARGDEGRPFSSLASVLVRRGLPAVIAMQYAITDEAAIEFSRGFYGALANQYPVDAALGEARKAMSLSRSDSLEWATPVLTMQTPDGVLWPTADQATMRDEKSMRPVVNTGGGAYVGGNLNVGGDFVGRDKIVGGDEVRKKNTGDRITANISGVSGSAIAVGKNIRQNVQIGGGVNTEEDRQQILAGLAQVQAALNSATGDPRTLGRAEGDLATLQAELTKSGDQPPDAATITRVGDWLLDHVPELAGALTELFGLPAVGRLLAKAGEPALAWVKGRLGRSP